MQLQTTRFIPSYQENAPECFTEATGICQENCVQERDNEKTYLPAEKLQQQLEIRTEITWNAGMDMRVLKQLEHGDRKSPAFRSFAVPH